MKKFSYLPYLILIPLTHTILYSILTKIFSLNNNLSLILLGIIIGIITVFFIGLYYLKGSEFFSELYLDSPFKMYLYIWIALTIYLNILLVQYMFPGIIYLIINIMIHLNITNKSSCEILKK